MKKIYFLSAKEIVDKIRNNQLSAVKVAESFIERIEKFNKKISAWAFFDRSLFLEKAKESDNLRDAGKILVL